MLTYEDRIRIKAAIDTARRAEIGRPVPAPKYTGTVCKRGHPRKPGIPCIECKRMLQRERRIRLREEKKLVAS